MFMTIAQAVIIRDGYVLMVLQKTKRGKEVGNFPGGNIEEGETPEEACLREVSEETGYGVEIERLLHVKKMKKWTYLCTIVSGNLGFDAKNPENEDLLDIKWISVNEASYFDDVTFPILRILFL
ncbi:DNA mismatch repair protein MutT [Priestia megaterium]|nr:DNA mismatch repair protein MutT [Priestia megaterium]